MARAAEALAAGRRPDGVLRGRAERDVVGLLRPRDRVSLRPGNPLAIGDLAEEPARVPEGEDVLTVGINRAVALLADREIRDSRAKGPKRVLRELGPHRGDGAAVWLKTGLWLP